MVALSFILQQSETRTIELVMEAYIESLPKSDQELVRALQSKVLANSSPNDPSKRLAEQIRAFVAERFVRPARERGERRLSIEIKEVHRQMGLQQRYSAVVAALQGKAFLKACDLQLIESSELSESSSKVLVFRLR